MMDCGSPPHPRVTACLSTLYKHQRRPACSSRPSLTSQDQRPSIRILPPAAVAAAISRAISVIAFAAGEITAAILATPPNVHFLPDVNAPIREAIEVWEPSEFLICDPRANAAGRGPEGMYLRPSKPEAR